MISGLYAAGTRDDSCQIWAANAAVDYVVVSSAPVSAALVGWQQFRGLDMFPWSTLASYLHPYAYLTLRSLIASMVRYSYPAPSLRSCSAFTYSCSFISCLQASMTMMLSAQMALLIRS